MYSHLSGGYGVCEGCPVVPWAVLRESVLCPMDTLGVKSLIVLSIPWDP